MGRTTPPRPLFPKDRKTGKMVIVTSNPKVSGNWFKRLWDKASKNDTYDKDGILIKPKYKIKERNYNNPI